MQIFNTSAVVIQSTLHQSLTMFIQISHRPITNLIIWFIQVFCLIEIKMTKNTTSKQRNGIMCVTWRYYLKLIRHQLSQKKKQVYYFHFYSTWADVCTYLLYLFIARCTSWLYPMYLVREANITLLYRSLDLKFLCCGRFKKSSDPKKGWYCILI